MSGLDNISKLLGANTASDLLKQVGDGFLGTDNQKDYKHASKLMTPNGLALAPKQKFLFHVYFNLTDKTIIKSTGDNGLVGALVKTVQLPSFKLDTEEYIQYNRKRLVHNRIKYNPVQMTLHDDGAGNVLDLWTTYYQYHFADANYDYGSTLNSDPGKFGKTDYNGRDLYSPQRQNQAQGWGKTVLTPDITGDKPAFFKDIQIYGFNRGGYVQYTLINPVITMWDHDTYDYSEGGGVMEHKVQLQYEAVKYSDSSSVGENGENVPGFGNAARYDREAGPLGKPGSAESLDAAGGLRDTIGAVGTDLANGNLAGAIQKAGASARTFGSVDNLINVVTTDVVSNVVDTGLKAIKDLPKGTFNFPKAGEDTTNDTATPTKA